MSSFTFNWERARVVHDIDSPVASMDKHLEGHIESYAEAVFRLLFSGFSGFVLSCFRQ